MAGTLGNDYTWTLRFKVYKVLKVYCVCKKFITIFTDSVFLGSPCIF